MRGSGPSPQAPESATQERRCPADLQDITATNIVMAMRNDIRNDLYPRLRRTVLSSLVSAVAVIGAAGFALVAVIDSVGVFTESADGRVRASIPIPDQWIDTALNGTGAEVQNAGTGFADVAAAGVPAEITGDFLLAQTVSLVLAVLLAGIVGFAAISTLAGRLRWGLLSWLTITGGAVLTVGSMLTQALSSTAAENLAIWMLPAGDSWLEPGFLAGLDFTVPLTGIALVVLGAAFRGSARYAREADGVV